jgi:hypothetical protein
VVWRDILPVVRKGDVISDMAWIFWFWNESVMWGARRSILPLDCSRFFCAAFLVAPSVCEVPKCLLYMIPRECGGRGTTVLNDCVTKKHSHFHVIIGHH